MVNTNNAESAISRMISALTRSGIRVDRLSVSDITVEDVFIRLEKAEAS
jgi:ribosomal protein L20